MERDPNRPSTLKRPHGADDTSWMWIGLGAIVLVAGLIVWTVVDDTPNTATVDNAPMSPRATTGASPPPAPAPKSDPKGGMK
jgi:hypothetical protein